MATSVIDGAPRTRQGRLTGPSRPIDRRINAARADLANAALADVVTAPRYAVGVHRRCTAVITMLHADCDDAAVAVSALLLGEVFVVFDVTPGGWAWGQCLHDLYVGWVHTDHLGDGAGQVTHRVAAPAASVFTAPDIKAPVVATLPLNARVAMTGLDNGFVATALGFVHARQLKGIDERGGDPVAVATGFTGSPYVWGGRSRDGVDCSGLIQAALTACGIFCPRDADQQADAFAVVTADDRRRGDLVVFPGHIGILTDADTLIHANAHWMTTLAEPLAVVAGRVAPTGFRRPPAVATVVA